jgi:ankyrin repeat protein
MNRRCAALLRFLLPFLVAVAWDGGGGARADATEAIFGSYYENIARLSAKNNTAKVTQLLAGGANPNQLDEETRTGLHYCAMNGNIQLALVLIKNGGHLDAKDKVGNMPLHWAADRNQPAITDVFLQLGAPIDAENKQGMTPLMIAASRGNVEIVQMLIAHGANPRKVDYTGRDAASWADESHRPAAAQAIRRALAARRS